MEIFNIPSVPKLESKRTDQGRPTLQTKIYPINTPLPWLRGYRNSLVGDEKSEWRHAGFLGGADTQEWAQLILSAVSPEQILSTADRQTLNGRGWLAAFVVTEEGVVAGQSYVPASFALGIKRLLAGQSLDGLSDDKVPAQPLVPVEWDLLQSELQQALKPLGNAALDLPLQYVIRSTLRKRKKDEGKTNKDADVEFMNSFYLDDLNSLITEVEQRRSLGRPLQQYLSDATALSSLL